MQAKGVESGDGRRLSKHLVAQLVSGYSEESTLYQMLFGFTSRQRRCLGDGGDLSEFLEIIDQKDAVLNQIAALESELESLRARWVGAPCAQREDAARQLNPILDEIITTIQRTVELERDNERLLEARRRELHRILAGARRWRSGSPDAASPPPSAVPARFIPRAVQESEAIVATT